MIPSLLRFQQRGRGLLMLCTLVLLMNGLQLWGGMKSADPWGHVIFLSIFTGGMWQFLTSRLEVGMSIGSRSSLLTQVLPLRAKDLWLASILPTWVELVLAALVTVGLALVSRPDLLAVVPSFLAHYALGAGFLVLLYQSRDPASAELSGGWTSWALLLLGGSALFAAAQLRSVLFTGALTTASIGLGLRTWRHLPQSFSWHRPMSSSALGSRGQLDLFRHKQSRLGAEARLMLSFYQSDLLLLYLCSVPCFGLAYPWLWQALGLLAAVSGVSLAWPFTRTLHAWRKLAYMPISPRRFFVFHTSLVGALFAGGYAVGIALHTKFGGVEHQAPGEVGVEAALSLLVLALFCSLMLATPMGRLRRKRLAEGTFTVLGGTPLQLGSNLLMLALGAAFYWTVFFEAERMQALLKSVTQGFPFSPFIAWALLMLSCAALWLWLERRFRCFDPGFNFEL